MAEVTKLDGLSGAQKAAIMMLSVGEEGAQQLFALMDEDEIKEISQTMANLGTVNATVIERLFVEFADQISSTGTLTGTYESTERLLSKVLDKGKVDQIMEEIVEERPDWRMSSAMAFTVVGIVNMDAVPEDRRHLPLGGEDNPIPLAYFLSEIDMANRGVSGRHQRKRLSGNQRRRRR